MPKKYKYIFSISYLVTVAFAIPQMNMKTICKRKSIPLSTNPSLLQTWDFIVVVATNQSDFLPEIVSRLAARQ